MLKAHSLGIGRAVVDKLTLCSHGVHCWRTDPEKSAVATMKASAQSFVKLFEAVVFNNEYDEHLFALKQSGSAVIDLLTRAPAKEVMDGIDQQLYDECHRPSSSTTTAATTAITTFAPADGGRRSSRFL